MNFSKTLVALCVVAVTTLSLPASAQLSEELVSSHEGSTSDGWTQFVTMTVTNTSRFLYKNAEVDVKFTGGLDKNIPTFGNAIVSTTNLKPGAIWHIKYAVTTSVFNKNNDPGYMITRISGIRNGNSHVSYRSSLLDVPFLFTNGLILHGSMTSPTDLFNAVDDASYLGTTANIKSAIKAGADVNAQDSKGNTALIKAVVQNEHYVVNALLEGKANPNVENFDGTTALDYALLASPGKVKEAIVSALQKSGAVKGSGNKAIYSQDHELFARVQKVTSESGDPGMNVSIIEGIVTNLTARTLSSVEIDSDFLDGGMGNVVGTGLATVQNLGPHEVWHFKITSSANDAYDYKLTKLEGH